MEKLCYKCNTKIPKDLSVYGLHELCFKDWFNLTSVESFTDIAAQAQQQDYIIAGTVSSSFFHGMFRKYSATLNGVKYILKIKENEYPELPATEFLCNQIL